MKNNCYFLTSLFPYEIYSEIVEYSSGPIANANNELQWSIFLGLNEYYPDIYLMNFPNVGGYPFKYKALHVSGCDIKIKGKTIGESYSFINLIYLKHFLKYIKILNKLKHSLKESDSFENITIFIYDLYPPFLKAISKMKNKYNKNNLHVCLIVPDINGMTGNKDNIISNFIKRREASTISASYNEIDSFVLISEHMLDYIPVGDRPWVVIEGILNIDKIKDINSQTLESKIFRISSLSSDNFKIFYSGALDERNGVINLLDSFKLNLEPSFRLIICGDGQSRSLVEKRAENDTRIVYLGQIPYDEVIKLQSEVDLLVNPRPLGQSFTKYSFPSKTMEYFASGTPVLMYRLEGIPSQYFEYCYTAKLGESNLETVSLLAQEIRRVFQLPLDVRERLATQAKEFIINNKNLRCQCKKIYNMIERKL